MNLFSTKQSYSKQFWLQKAVNFTCVFIPSPNSVHLLIWAIGTGQLSGGWTEHSQHKNLSLFVYLSCLDFFILHLLTFNTLTINNYWHCRYSFTYFIFGRGKSPSQQLIWIRQMAAGTATLAHPIRMVGIMAGFRGEGGERPRWGGAAVYKSL